MKALKKSKTSGDSMINDVELDMKMFLIEKFKEDEGSAIYNETRDELEILLNKTKDKTETQMVTLRKTIMPRIALYNVLQRHGINKDEAYTIVKSYMVDVVCARMTSKFQKLNKMPFLYQIMKKNIVKSLLHGGNWEAELINDEKDTFTCHVHKCLWYDATVENGCPELCRAFCECDDINFDAFTKVDFYREGSLGMGCDKCDFKFTKSKK